MEIRINHPQSFCQLGQRTNQEDCRYPNADFMSEDQGFFIVCDGVGGQDAGEVASSLVCTEFARRLADCTQKRLTEQMIQEAANQVAAVFMERAKGECLDMGTTLAMLCLHREGVMAVHAGDSRIYHIRKHKVIFRTEDHSMVNDMVRNGTISRQEAENHPLRNIITNSFYRKCIVDGKISVSIKRLDKVKTGDYFLLCSDGVYNAVSDEQLLDILADRTLSDGAKMKRLSQICLHSGDNNTAILIPIREVHAEVGFFKRIIRYLR